MVVVNWFELVLTSPKGRKVSEISLRREFVFVHCISAVRPCVFGVNA